MAEKRVSVRLVAEGGRQVRAELEGIGDAGARGFGAAIGLLKDLALEVWDRIGLASRHNRETR